MKTAVTVPDKTFERAESLAKSLDWTRSEFISRAINYYADCNGRP